MRNSLFNIQSSIFNSTILQLALPSVVTNITVPLLGLVDTAIVGHMGRAEYIGGVAIGTTIFNMTYWLLGFLRMGTTGIVSQAYGAGDTGLQREALRRGVRWALALSAMLLVMQGPLLQFSLWLMEPETEVARLAAEYFRVAIWGCPAMLASYVLTDWFIGMQDTRTPMRMALLQNLMNIALTLLFVFVFHLGVAGVALGTVVGLYGGVAYAVHRRTHPLTPPCEGGEYSHSQTQGETHSTPSLTGRAGGGSVYIYIFLRTLCLVAVTVYFTSAGSLLGTLYLDANALLMQFFVIYSYFTDGLANAAEALSGKYQGAGVWTPLRRTLRALFSWGAGLGVVFTIAYALCGGWFLGLLTDQQAVLGVAQAYLPWVVAVPLVAMPAFVWDGVYIGMTLTRRMFLSMLVSAIVFFALWFLLGPSNHVLWFAFLAYLATRSLMQTVLFRA